MLIKLADDPIADIAALRLLAEQPGLDAATRERIDREIRIVRAGFKGERRAVYEIEFLLGANNNHATIHDLRIEVGGRIAQIDHLIIDRVLGITVCETKHFSRGVRINEHGEWTANGHGIASPIEQNCRHIAVLKDLFDRGLVKLPTRLGISIKPRYYSLILIAPDARIDRPTGRPANAIKDLDTVIKADQLPAALERQLAFGRELDLVKLVSRTTLMRLAGDLAALHRPIHTDWAARFGLPNRVNAEPTPIGAFRSAGVCASCGHAVSRGVLAYCNANAARFAGRVLCMPCQPERQAMHVEGARLP